MARKCSVIRRIQYPQIQGLIDRLELSPSDVLALAREVAEDRALRSVDFLTFDQRRRFLGLLLAMDEAGRPWEAFELLTVR